MNTLSPVDKVSKVRKDKYLKLLSDLRSIQEQPGAETVHWAKGS